MVTVTTERKEFVRDLNSKALLMSDHSKADDYISRKKMLQKQKQTSDDVEQLKQEVQSIHNKIDMLISIFNKDQ